MQPKTQQLRAAVRAILIPYLDSCGFRPDAREVYKPDTNRFFIERFSRKSADKLELLDIQFEKHGRPRFVLNFGVAPPEGVDYYGYHYTQNGVGIAALPVWGRLCARRLWGLRWFGFPSLRVPLLRDPSAEEVIEETIRALPQVETWFRAGLKGPNIGIVEAPSDQLRSPNPRAL